MKKTAIGVIALLTLGAGLTACSSKSASTPTPTTPAASSAGVGSTTPSASRASGSATLTKGTDGKLADTDPKANVVADSGFRIAIEPGAKGKATFQLIDPASGKDFSNYFIYDYAKNTFVKHLVSSAMGKTYDYTVDLATGKLQSVFDADGHDLSESTKQAGRWEHAETATLDSMKAIDTYFTTRYGETVKQAVTGA